ncbi:hypothetical protein [Vagococcus fluvialis]|uniref:hypothetical protein n=1 Tax=Vagococcus fluvialis TaxID=2738 RepID=UPI001D0A1670|nr:hypothetical protein [Vagococcus fluvialis]UDM81165.1 hypothetical protein K5K97_14075 [Vagococcus fluvialis]
MISKNKRLVTGTISEIYTNVPETKQSLNNAKTATVKYEVDNKIYFSENRINVSMNSQIGDSIEIYYEVTKPSKIHKKIL